MSKAKKHPLIEHNGRYLYPWFTMEVGDWFLVPERRTVASAASWIHRTYQGLRFSIQKQKDGTVRCYRVAA